MDRIRLPGGEVGLVLKDNGNNGSLAHVMVTCSPTLGSGPGGYQPKMSASLYNGSPPGGSYAESDGVTTRPETVVDSAMPPKKLTCNDIPVLDSFPGYYGFDLYRPLCGDAYEAADTKPSTAYFYFKDEQGWTNLYAKKTPTWWTMSYWCQRQPPEGSFLRLTPVYGTSDKQQEVIQRCFEDFMAIPTSSMARYSILMVGNSLADYFFDTVTERLCVTLPYERPKEGCEYNQFNGKFMCFNSCLYNGGQGNKKPLFLIVTLERMMSGKEPSKGQCEVLGRQCIKFRSCACPKRDKENSERRTGDTPNYGIQTFGKRKKDSDRLDRHGKKSRPHNLDFSTGKLDGTSILWGNSPSNDAFISPEARSDSLEDRGEMCNGEVFVDPNTPSTQSPTIHYNGESYHLLLVPTGLPGGFETMSSVRFGLIRACLYNSPRQSRNSLSHQQHQQQTVLKQEVDTDKEASIKLEGPDCSYHEMGAQARLSAESVFNRLCNTEAQLTSFFRERLLQLSGTRRNSNNMYHRYSGDSIESLPNSAGPISGGVLNVGSMDDTGSPNHEFPPTGLVGPLSSDSGISTDHPMQITCNTSHSTNNGVNSLNLSNSTDIFNGMFTAAPASLTHRSVGLYGPAPPLSSSMTSYDMDYGNRFVQPPGSQIYMPPTLGNSTDSRLPIPSPYTGMELTGPYALIQHGSVSGPPELSAAPTVAATATVQRHPSPDSKLHSIANVSTTSKNLSTTNPTMAALSVNLNHAFNSSAFYPTNYFGNRPNSLEDSTNSALMDSFSCNGIVGGGGGSCAINSVLTAGNVHINGGGGGGNDNNRGGGNDHGGNTNLCFYPSQNTLGMHGVESLVLPEEMLTNYFERESKTAFADAENGITAGTHIVINRHPIRHSPSYSSSSPRSPNSACCDKVIILDM